MTKKSKLIANQVPKPEDNRSIIQRIRDLEIGEEEKVKIFEDIIAKKYPDRGWLGIKYDWSLNRRVDQWFDIIPDPNWRTAVWLAGRGFGKHVSQTTDIITLNKGWIKWGELEVGDILFTETGETTKVTHVHPVIIPEKCYRIYFSDGTTIDASDTHRWATWTAKDRKEYARTRDIERGSYPKNWIRWKKNPLQGQIISKELFNQIQELKNAGATRYKIQKDLNLSSWRTVHKYYEMNEYPKFSDFSEVPVGRIKTTQELADTLFCLEKKDNRLNHTIPQCSPLEFPEKQLPIHPFLLGIFLGDGSRESGVITGDLRDLEEYKKYLEVYGYKSRVVPITKKYDSNFKINNHYGNLIVEGMYGAIRKNNLHQNKHIPEDYLYGSIQQRKDLLAGLLATDGSYSSDGSQAYFYNTEKDLIDGVYWLVVSLGMHGVITKNENFCRGKQGKDIWRVRFSPTYPVFNLSRKDAKIKFNTRTFIERRHRTIVKIEQIDSIPMNCITVDSPNESYLITKSLVCSLNTRTGAEIARYLAENEIAERIGVVCPTAHDANAVFLYGNSGLFNISPPWFQPEHHPTYKNVTWPGRKTQLYLFALDITTQIPTPDGFKSISDIHVGDKVFDETGKECNVIYETPVMLGNRCYELTFKNGQKIICDKDHLWRISTLNDRYLEYNKGKEYKYRTVNTEYIVDNLRENNKHNDLNCWVRLTKAVDYPERSLPIDPYVLGVWLGDGDMNSGSLASKDHEIPAEIASLGYKVTHNPKYPIVWHINGLVTQIKANGLYRNKHIPEMYKFSSREQRLSLLQGLMDTDGTVSKTGEVSFSNTNENIIDGLREIVASLGGWTTKHLCKPRKINPYTDNEKPIWRVSIRKVDKIFRLPRKLEKMKERRRYHDIPVTDIREVDSVPVKCIRVDSESHLFLATKSYLPTHNSAEDPESLRGHQFDWMIMDELAAWNKGKAVWEQAILTNRLGKHPRAIVTTTPKANELIKAVVGNPDAWTITGSTQENADNIDVRQMVSMFEGTRMGKQELHGEILEDVEGALWKSEWIERNRILIKDPRDSRPLAERLPDFLYIVLAIDPAMTANKNSDETGLCVAAYGVDDKYYILYADSHKETAHEWAKRALALYDEYMVTSIVAETNQGGDLVLQNLTKLRPDISVHGVHAKKGKAESVNSPILTTKGWKTFGELTNDDLVFDDTGNPVSIEVLPIHEAECAKVTFSDGTSNVYAMEHEWRVLYGDVARRFTNSQRESLDTVVRWRKSGNGYFKTQEAYESAQKEARRLRGEGKSYKEIGNIFNFSHATAERLVQDGLYNNTCTNYVEKTTEEMMREMAEGVVFSIPQPPPLKMSGSSLIDPYLLGLWNADGCVGASVITQKTPEDTEIITEELRQRGFDVYLRNDLICIKDMRWVFHKRSKKGIYQDEWMVREEERLDLVRGMLDGDGYRPNNISLRLSQSGYRLQTVLDPISDAMRSLGWYVTVPQYKETHREPSYTVRVTPTVLDCTTLPRKQITYVPHSSRYRTIKSIEPVGIQTVRCISVDNESHMYLSGKGLVPTHNSLRAEEITHLYELNKVKHVGTFPKAEDQMTQFNPIINPDGDDDCVDSLVYACKALMEKAIISSVYSPAVGGLRHKLINFRAR